LRKKLDGESPLIFPHVPQEENTRPNQLVIEVTGPLGTGSYRCEITTETPAFVTLDRRKNITVVGSVTPTVFRVPAISVTDWTTFCRFCHVCKLSSSVMKSVNISEFF
jgi:hypothetical protein